MKRVLKCFPVLSLIIIIGIEQVKCQEVSYLCQGNFWTEDQGAFFLDSVRQTLKNQDDWKIRAGRIRAGIIQGAGLPDLSVSREVPAVKGGGAIQQEGYQLRSFAIQVNDTAWVYGNLYQPVPEEGKQALVLCPHGHWSNPSDYGRFRSDMQARCATLARMGAWVFAYDMLGYGETDYAPHNHPDGLTLQTLAGIRILDYFLSLPNLDPDRTAVTGASGGGTQSFLLAAVDERIQVSVPVVQVSAHFFGGCSCESGLPIHAWQSFQTNNVEIAALAAPRPQLLVSDGEDWTKNTPVVEYPFLKFIYGLYEHEDLVENKHFPNEGHDYGATKRQAVYQFLIPYLRLKPTAGMMSDTGQIKEDFVELLSYDKLKF